MPTPFETFFAGEFQRRLQAIQGEPGLMSNGLDLRTLSWDRKAAFLLWDAEGRGAPPAEDEDVMGF